MNTLKENVVKNIKVKENELLTREDNSIERANQMISYSTDLLNKLKQEVLTNGFRNQQEEISFFKEIKPQITGRILFYRKIIEVEIMCPKINPNRQKTFYKKQLGNVQKKLNNNELNKYILLQRKDKDVAYFLRKNISNFDFQKDFFLK